MTKAYLFLLVTVAFLSSVGSNKKSTSPLVTPNVYVEAYTMISKGEALLKDGDLVVRNNQDMTSQLIKSFNRNDKSFSHAGIVIYEDGYPFVYHILKGSKNPDEKIIKDSMRVFCNPWKNFGFGIFRYNLKSHELTVLKEVLKDWRREEIKFDSLFNLKTNDRMYCSELIKKLLEKATKKRIVIETTMPTALELQFILSKYKLPMRSVEDWPVVTIDNLYINPNCKEVQRFDFHFQ